MLGLGKVRVSTPLGECLQGLEMEIKTSTPYFSINRLRQGGQRSEVKISGSLINRSD